MPTKRGIGLCGLVSVVLLTLKLCNIISWSWWWVTAPLWIPYGALLMFLGFCVAMALLTGQLRQHRL
jgi:hypothetical protein